MDIGGKVFRVELDGFFIKCDGIVKLPETGNNRSQPVGPERVFLIDRDQDSIALPGSI